jgi:Holliday junction DNA helicase RuvA
VIALLRGILRAKRGDSVVIDVAGIGYEIFLSGQSLGRLPAVGEEVEVHTYLHLREDNLQLFGFISLVEKEMFLQLISVSKIGPKSALAALSTFPVSSLKKAILVNDVDLISSIPGIGKKTAQRLVLELKEKISAPELAVTEGEGFKALRQAREALVNLGYAPSEASRALEDLDPGAEIEELIRKALQTLGKR